MSFDLAALTGSVVAGLPGVRACLLGSLVVGILGFALNDSGVAIPAMMFGMVLPWVTWLLLRTEAST